MKKIGLIFSLLNKREKQQLILMFLVLLFMGFIELIGVGSISPFIAVVTNPSIIHSNAYLNRAYDFFHFSSDRDFIAAFGTAVILMIAASNLYLAFVFSLITTYSAKRNHSISMRLMEKYLRQNYIFFLNINTAGLTKNIIGDVNVYTDRILLKTLQLVSSTIISLFIVVLLIIVNPPLALIISAVLGLAYLAIFTAVRRYLARIGIEKNIQNTLRYKYLNESFGGIKDVKILGKEGVFLNFFSGPSRKFCMNEAKGEIVNEIPKYLLETIAIGGILGIILVMIRSGAKMETLLPVLTVYAFGAYRLLPSLQKIFKAVASIKYNFPVLESLTNDYVKLPPGNELFSENDLRAEFRKRIQLEWVSFAYPGSQKLIIKNQNLTITANTSIALVGATGCGKTTLVDIILGLLEPSGGKLLVDGMAINDANRKSWQKNLGYVPQSIYLTDDTIKNNIAFGIAPEAIDNDAVIRAAKLANIHDFVDQELEMGYDAIIGERGIRLSGGQRQRIGIARAVYHDPSVLILDEATSALDSLTENAIMDAIQNMSHKKTIIIIAHRITTVKKCDLIYMMDKGIFTDQGSYEELYQKNETFKNMADGTRGVKK